MLKILDLFTRIKAADPVRSAYEAIVAGARHPRLYAGVGVPDTVDGRFDMIVLHMILVLDRLKRDDSAHFAQKLIDEMFADMDRSLREMGVGDLSVGKKVRKMGEVYYGRVRAYGRALQSGDPRALADALERNIFPDTAPREGAVAALAAYVLRARQRLAQTSVADICAGHIVFAEAE
ncbi:ubiquinol-cytochrome C chaperone family protein [soil metagenome]